MFYKNSLFCRVVLRNFMMYNISIKRICPLKEVNSAFYTIYVCKSCFTDLYCFNP